MRWTGLLLAVLGLGCALTGCASFNTRPYRQGQAGACDAALGAGGSPGAQPNDDECLRNGISYYDLMPAVVTYRLTTATGSNGSQVDCEPQCMQEYKLIPDPERRMVLEYRPGLFGANKLEVSFRENGTLSSIGIESTGVPGDVAVAAIKAALPAPAGGAAAASSPTAKCTGTPSVVSVVRVTKLEQLKALKPGGDGTAGSCPKAPPSP